MGQKNNFTVYYHVFPNDKIYVGITSNSVKQRWRNGNGYYGQTIIYRAILKYRWSNIQHCIFKEGLSQQEATLIEQQLIKEWNTLTPNGYNNSTAEYYNNADIFNKQISCYDINGELIATYKNQQEAINEIGKNSASSISECAHRKIPIAYGFQWRFGKEKNIGPLSNYFKKHLLIDQFDLEGNFIKTYKSASEAANEIAGIKHGKHILIACGGENKTAYGFQWRFHVKAPKCPSFTPRTKIVSKYSLERILLNTYNSVTEAAKDNMTSKQRVIDQCKGKHRTAEEYFFRYRDEEKLSPVIRYIDTLKEQIYMYSLNDKKLICSFNSVADASVFIKDKSCNKNISACACGKRNYAYGYIWSYLKWEIAPDNYKMLNYENYIKRNKIT